MEYWLDDDCQIRSFIFITNSVNDILLKLVENSDIILIKRQAKYI